MAGWRPRMVASEASRTAARAPARPRPIAWLVRSLKIAAVAVGVTAASVGGYWGFLQYEGNLHPVVAGVLYRSAQPSSAELASTVQQYGIKSVLNLRGPNAGS